MQLQLNEELKDQDMVLTSHGIFLPKGKEVIKYDDPTAMIKIDRYNYKWWATTFDASKEYSNH